MQFVFNNNLRSVLLIYFLILANAQRTSNSFRDVDFNELARQNKITKQILEAFIQKKLGLRSSQPVKPPSIMEILPVKKVEDKIPEQEEQEEEQGQDYVEDDSLQSVESEQIDSIYEGRKKYAGLENELDSGNYNRKL